MFPGRARNALPQNLTTDNKWIGFAIRHPMILSGDRTRMRAMPENPYKSPEAEADAIKHIASDRWTVVLVVTILAFFTPALVDLISMFARSGSETGPHPYAATGPG